MAATISYGPRRVPVVSGKECRDYRVMSLTAVENFNSLSPQSLRRVEHKPVVADYDRS